MAALRITETDLKKMVSEATKRIISEQEILEEEWPWKKIRRLENDINNLNKDLEARNREIDKLTRNLEETKRELKEAVDLRDNYYQGFTDTSNYLKKIYNSLQGSDKKNYLSNPYDAEQCVNLTCSVLSRLYRNVRNLTAQNQQLRAQLKQNAADMENYRQAEYEREKAAALSNPTGVGYQMPMENT